MRNIHSPKSMTGKYKFNDNMWFSNENQTQIVSVSECDTRSNIYVSESDT